MSTMIPTATISNGSFEVFGAASAHSALGDGLDASYVLQRPVSASVDPTLEMGLSAHGPLPAYTIVRSLRIDVKVGQAVLGMGPLRLDLVVEGVGSSVGGVMPLDSVPQSFAVYIANRPGGGMWQEDDLQSLRLRLVGPRATTAFDWTRINSVSVTPVFNYAPYAAPTGPASVTNTSKPLLTWYYFDADGDRQGQFEAKVFSGATAVADPGTETARLVGHIPPTHLDGASEGTLSFEAPGLRNGTYRWAIRVKDQGGTLWGQWLQATLTINNPANAAPSMTATPNTTTASYTIVLNATADAYADPTFFLLERSDDFGVTWSTVRGGVEVAYAGSAVTVIDYEAPRMAASFTAAIESSVNYNAAISYNAGVSYAGTITTPATGTPNVVRYRATAVRVVSGEEIWSSATVVEPASLIADNRTWLKHPTDPARSIVISPNADFTPTSEEAQAALRAIGRADWVVFGDIPSLEQGDLEMVFPGDAAWHSFEVLRATATPVPMLLQTCFGDTALDQLWIRLGPNRAMTRVTHHGQRTKQYRRATVGFHETARPLD